MRMKFKSTTLNPKALVYRRFIALEQSINTNTLYKTYDDTFWAFNSETLTFIPISANSVPASSTIVLITNNQTYLQYKDKYFYYHYDVETMKYLWEMGTPFGLGITLLSASFNNIAKYQVNKYYYIGCFDYMQRGGISNTTTQYVKGNIIPLRTMNIKYFNDDMKLRPDDLVVVKGRLYSVENPEEDHKHQPKDYTVYFATLNSIL